MGWARHLVQDVSLFRQGLSLLSEVGTHGLGEMVRTAEFLQRSVYEDGSFRVDGDGFAFRLLNPPMRVGAFHEVALAMDGRPIDPAESFVAEGTSPTLRPLATLSRERPLHLLPGQGARFRARCADLLPRQRHTVQLTLRNVAIPPRVWIRFTEELQGATG